MLRVSVLGVGIVFDLCSGFKPIMEYGTNAKLRTRTRGEKRKLQERMRFVTRIRVLQIKVNIKG